MSDWDKSKLVECPTLKPTDAEFADPITYLSRPDIKRLGDEYGIVKVVPPQNWKPYFTLSTEFRFHTRLQRLSDLGLLTRSRKFFTDNINRFQKMRRKKSLRSYFTVDHTRVHYYDLFVQVENSGGYSSTVESTWTKLNQFFNLPNDSDGLHLEYDKVIKPYAEFLHDNESSQFPASDSEDEYESCLICGKHDAPTKTLLCDNCDNPFHLKCLDPPMSAIPDGEWYCNKCLIGTGEYGFEEEVDVKYSLRQFFDLCQTFTDDFMRDTNMQNLTVDNIEKVFWDLVDKQNSDLEVKYGADIHNLIPGQISGFPMMNTPAEVKEKYPQETFDFYRDHQFNLTNLPFAKGSLLNYIENPISGMTVPWIYIGSLLSTFCWHVEDHYTLSANYCHFGSTKKWYAIPSRQADDFEKLMRDSAPDLFKKQPDLLHQLVTLLSPMKIVENGIRCCYANQGPNEFVITYPRVYHAGFNSGFNFNEAVNFTMDPWLDFGEKSIADYRKIKKENVFNHYVLVEKILQRFVENPENMNLDLVDKCLLSFQNFLQKNYSLLDQLDVNDFKLEHRKRERKVRDLAKERALVYESDDDDSDTEEPLCDSCKTHLAFHYCIIDNNHRNFRGVPDKPRQTTPPSQLLTPQTTPQEQVHKFETIPSVPESSERLSIIVKEEFSDESPVEEGDTSDSSDSESSEEEFKEEDDENEEVYKPKPSSRGRRGANPRNKRKVPEFEELALMIEEEKKRKNQNEEEGQRKLRKSNRLEHSMKIERNKSGISQSKMGMVANRTNLKQLNSKDQIQLCLQCLLKCYQDDKKAVQSKTTVISEVHPSEIDEFVKEVGRILAIKKGVKEQ